MRLADARHRGHIGVAELRLGDDFPVLDLHRLGMAHVIGVAEQAGGLGPFRGLRVKAIEDLGQDCQDLQPAFAQSGPLALTHTDERETRLN